MDASRTATIDFAVTLADGTLLTDAARLCATVREYAWWVRDPRYSRIDDAVTHATMVRNLINLAHALSLRGLRSFAQLQPYDVEQLVEECRYGADAVWHASERMEAHLAAIQATDSLAPSPFGGLPRYPDPQTGKAKNIVYAMKLVTSCNLPAGASKLPRIATLISQSADTNGLSRKSASGRVLSPLPNITIQALQRWLDPLEQLHAMRHRLEAESIGFKPFPHGAARVAAVKGIGTQRTPIPPPRLALHLLEKAAMWVADHVARPIDEQADLHDVRRLATASWILIAAFTARRDEEVNELGADCLRGDDRDGWWLNVYIEKTLQRKEWIPVPGIVATAVRLMMTISATARDQSGSDSIFQWCHADGKLIRFDARRHLNDFATAVGVPEHQPRGKPAAFWHWHPHQFRRFFAVLYFYRFEGATLEALSHHLRHFTLEMTRRYVTQDPEVAALWTDVEWGYMGEVARSIAAGERSVAGAMGERLKKTARRLVDVFRRKLQVASPERVGASLTIIMQRQGLVLTPKPWVTCSCPRTRDAAALAACRRVGGSTDGFVGPDFTNAGPTVCPCCPHAIVGKVQQAFGTAEAIDLEAVVAARPRADTIFGALEAARVVELRRIANRPAEATPLAQSDAANEEEPA